MKVENTILDGVVALTPQVLKDTRGYFMESFRQDKAMELLGIESLFVLELESRSIKNTLRGLHYQLPPHDQSKLVSVSYGRVLDVVVDLRESSKDFKRHLLVELSDQNNKQLYVPKGFGHGFLVLSDIAVMHYKLDGYYEPSSYTGVNIFDQELDIKLPISQENAVISQKDLQLPLLNSAYLFN